MKRFLVLGCFFSAIVLQTTMVVGCPCRGKGKESQLHGRGGHFLVGRLLGCGCGGGGGGGEPAPEIPPDNKEPVPG